MEKIKNTLVLSDKSIHIPIWNIIPKKEQIINKTSMHIPFSMSKETYYLSVIFKSIGKKRLGRGNVISLKTHVQLHSLLQYETYIIGKQVYGVEYIDIDLDIKEYLKDVYQSIIDYEIWTIELAQVMWYIQTYYKI